MSEFKCEAAAALGVYGASVWVAPKLVALVPGLHAPTGGVTGVGAMVLAVLVALVVYCVNVFV